MIRWRVVLLVSVLALGAAGQRAYAAITNPGYVTCPAGTESRLNDVQLTYKCWNEATQLYEQPVVFQGPGSFPGESGQVYCAADYWAIAAGSLGTELWCSESWLFGPDIDGLQLPDATVDGVPLEPETIAEYFGAGFGVLVLFWALGRGIGAALDVLR